MDIDLKDLLTEEQKKVLAAKLFEKIIDRLDSKEFKGSLNKTIDEALKGEITYIFEEDYINQHIDMSAIGKLLTKNILNRMKEK